MSAPAAETQVCTKCHATKSLSEFYAEKRSRSGLRANCKICHRTDVLAREKTEEGRRQKRSPERKAWKRAYRQRPEVKARERTYYWLKLQFDPAFKLAYLLRVRACNALKRQAKGKSGSPLRLLGCDAEFLALYLEMQFQPGMDWGNHGLRGWHIDHKKPLSSFDLSDASEAARAFHFTNLQPLWAADNLSKGARL